MDEVKEGDIGLSGEHLESGQHQTDHAGREQNHHGEIVSSILPDHIRDQAGGDDEEDNWSRQVEMDEATTVGYIPEDSFRMESVLEQQEQVFDNGLASLEIIPQPPAQPELTLKEKLVLRERQRRIETEKARLKRQFALSGTSDANNEDSANNHNHFGTSTSSNVIYENDVSIDYEGNSRRDGSIADESTKAYPDHESPAHDDATRLGFNMERFLRNSDAFDPTLQEVSESNNNEAIKNIPDPNVLMERFLSAPIIVPVLGGDSTQQTNEVVPFSRPEATTGSGKEDIGALDRGAFVEHRSVSFDIVAPPVEPIASFGYDVGTNTSLVSSNSAHDERAEMDVDVDTMLSPSMDVQDYTSNASDGIAFDEPRVLRLTEADMEEMAAIDDASIGNAPPSEREEEILSEIGELADFATSHHLLGADNTAASLDTPTTAMESASQISEVIGYQSHRLATISMLHPTSNSSVIDVNDNESTGQQSVEHLPIQSLTNELLQSPGAVSNQSVAVNPPSIVGIEEEEMTVDHVLIEADEAMNNSEQIEATEQRFDLYEVGNDDVGERLWRSGLAANSLSEADGFPSQSLSIPFPSVSVPNNDYETTTVRIGAPYSQPSENLGIVTEDTGKDIARSSPGLALKSKSQSGSDMPSGNHVGYGAIEEGRGLRSSQHSDNSARSMYHSGESAPLLGEDAPPELIKRWKERRSTLNRQHQGSGNHFPSIISYDNMTKRLSFQPKAVVDSVFDEVRSLNDIESVEAHDDSKHYFESSTFKRAFPERQLALLITLMLEIPVLLVITGKGDDLCQLVGRRKYNLLIGILPLTSAISGNVGLQASTLTTRAISHYHVTNQSYIPWLVKEVGAAMYLGFGMGLVLGAIAFVSSGYDIPLAITVAIAQFISVVTAGITGTFAPLLFSFVFHRDSGKWGGPLETAIQDIVGSFAMMVISFKILLLFGKQDIDPGDVCGTSQ